jgi:hypothetical protein
VKGYDLKQSALYKAGAVVAIAVALVFAGGAYPQYPRIISSFPLLGATPPDPRGIHYAGNNVYVISPGEAGENYLYKYTWDGWFISSIVLPGAQDLADADRLPEPCPDRYFAVVDTVPNDVKIYTTEGSFVGTVLQPPAHTVAIGVDGHAFDYVYLATREGVVFRYTSEGSFLSSFATGIRPGDLTGSGGYGGSWGDFIQISPRGTAGPIYSYKARSGSLVGTFNLPGVRNRGASTRWKCRYQCIREGIDGLWIYDVDLGRGMAVAPASLGRVKALFR